MNDAYIKAAKYFIKKCDAHDHVICTGERDGEPWPANRHELSVVERYANKIKNEIIASGFRWRIVNEAIQILEDKRR